MRQPALVSLLAPAVFVRAWLANRLKFEKLKFLWSLSFGICYSLELVCTRLPGGVPCHHKAGLISFSLVDLSRW